MAATTMAIPNRWDPRTKQQPIGLIACRLRAAVLFDPASGAPVSSNHDRRS